MYVVTTEELKEALKELYDKREADCRTKTLAGLVPTLTLIIDIQATLIKRLEEENNDN